MNIFCSSFKAISNFMENTMYYHVFIETNNDNSISDFDRNNLEKIKDEIISPYLKNNIFYLKGYKLSNNDIKRFLVIQTSENRENIYRSYKREHPRSLLYDRAIIQKHENSLDITNNLLREVENKIQIENKSNNIGNKMINNKIFIVHGRNNESKISVARFIEQLGLEAIILHEQPNAGKTIIEKIEEYTDVGFAIVLYTPCDFGGLKGSKEQKPRARQNVVFEHGYLIAKLGRDRVCALLKEEVEFPSDISGVVYHNFDDNDAWKVKLARELKDAGYQIDMNKIKI